MAANSFRNSRQLGSVLRVEQSTDHGHPRQEAGASISTNDRYFA
jgi:hypothetical protein